MKVLKGSNTLTYMMINQAYFEIALNCYYDKNTVKASKQPNKKKPWGDQCDETMNQHTDLISF